MNRIKQMSLMQKVLVLLLVIAVAALIVAVSLNMSGSSKSSKDKKAKTKNKKQIEGCCKQQKFFLFIRIKLILISFVFKLE